jgi:hypothetical protein
METTNTFSWFFLNLKAGGVNMDNIAVFSDCGKQMCSQRRLLKFGYNWLHTKNCTLYIAKNVCARFSPNDLSLHNLMFQLQSTKSVAEYIIALVEITKNYFKKPDNR